MDAPADPRPSQPADLPDDDLVLAGLEMAEPPEVPNWVFQLRIRDARQTFLGIWIRCVLEGKPFEVWGGAQLRDMTYVDDVTAAFLAAAETEASWGKIYNIGGAPPASLHDIAETVVRVSGGQAKFTTREFPADRATVDLRVLIPSFMISELRRGFEMGFLIALPFLIIDMIVATLTMSMGMMMLPPSLISLPMKLLFFVLIDGWNMLIGSLVRSVN